MTRIRSIPRPHLWLAAAFISVLGGCDAAAQTPIPPSTPDFALAAMQSGEYEILAAHDALAQSHNQRVLTFAQQMIDDHTGAIESLRKASTSSGLTQPPETMSSDQAALLASLQSLRGDEFDKAYVRQQVLAHRQALAVAESYARSGKDANLRKIAQSSASLIKHHLDMAEQLHSALGDS
jgi:putative membrane protein